MSTETNDETARCPVNCLNYAIVFIQQVVTVTDRTVKLDLELDNYVQLRALRCRHQPSLIRDDYGMGKSTGKISMYARKTNSEKILLWQKLFWNAKKTLQLFPVQTCNLRLIDKIKMELTFTITAPRKKINRQSNIMYTSLK